jgi:exopolysaccharide production protein ExoZ
MLRSLLVWWVVPTRGLVLGKTLYSIQYLRAVAALTVVIAHAFLHPLAEPTRAINLMRMGSLGVILFFVISGFIMVYITGPGRMDGLQFMLRRLERIVPLYWAVTLLVSALALIAPSLLHNTEFTLPHIVTSLLFIPYRRENGEIAPMMMLGWTLNYEMFFYLVIAFTAGLDATRRVAVVTLFFLVLTLVGIGIGTDATIPYFYTRPIILSFCIGMWIGWVWLRQPPFLKAQSLPIVTAALGAAFIVAGFTMQRQTPLNLFNTTAFTLGSAAFILCGLTLEHLPMRWRSAKLIGDSSYAIYLIHMYFVAASVLIVRKIVGGDAPLLIAALSLVTTVPASILVHLWFERPLLRCLRRTNDAWRPSAELR